MARRRQALAPGVAVLRPYGKRPEADWQRCVKHLRRARSAAADPYETGGEWHGVAKHRRRA